ncbi:putative Jhy protein [Plasmopara halstedii]
MSFLDRFRGKIATVTAQGHLKKADGSEEIRVGAPKRRPQRQVHKLLPDNNNDDRNVHTKIRQPTNIQSWIDVGPVVSTKPAVSPPVDMKGSYIESPEESQWELTHSYPSQSAREAPCYEYDDEMTGLPGRVSNDVAGSQLPTDVKGTKFQGRRLKNANMQSTSQECRLQKESNDTKAPNDQLAFSRKARPVQYEPCNLSQYRKEKPDGYFELGKLQPDLNTDELVEKRAKIERMKAFSQNRRTINKNTQANRPADASRAQVVVSKPASSREKGLAFAKCVPKPRSSQKTDTELLTDKTDFSRNQFIKPKSAHAYTDNDSDDDELDAELQLLQQRHKASRAEVKALVG